MPLKDSALVSRATCDDSSVTRHTSYVTCQTQPAVSACHFRIRTSVTACEVDNDDNDGGGGGGDDDYNDNYDNDDDVLLLMQ